MIWTDGWLYARHEAPPDWRSDSISISTHSATRWAVLESYRRALARAEADALRCRLDEERLVSDTRIRALHMRVDGCEPFVRLATGLTFHPPGSLAHSQHLLELGALVEERRRNQRAPDAPQEQVNHDREPWRPQPKETQP